MTMLSASPNISVIISTYNHPKWLEKVLIGFANQTEQNFEIVIADDGSSPETAMLIKQMQLLMIQKITHVWHEDNGFQKCVILNKAITKSAGDYLIFTDGDCIPRKEFVATHKKNARYGYFLSGGYFKLPLSCSDAIDQHAIETGMAFDINWLLSHGYPKQGKRLRLVAQGWFAHLCNWLIPTAKTWNGHNASGWKKDIVAVNGFDERMQYGGEDCEMGDRLKNTGIKVQRIRYTAVCVHLDHARGYVTSDMRAKNKIIRNRTQELSKTYTEYGLIQAKTQCTSIKKKAS